MPCRAEAPHLEALSRKYRDQGLVILGFNDERQPAAAIDFARKTLTYPLLTGARRVFEQYRVRVIPCTIIIDRDGTIVTRHTGFAPGSERVMEDGLKQLLSAADRDQGTTAVSSRETHLNAGGQVRR